MENNYDIFKQIEQQHPLPETFDPNTFRPVYNGRELNTNSYYPPDETPAPMYFNYNKFAEPPVSAYFGSSVNAVELLEDPSLVPVIDRRVDPNKIFNSDVQSFKTLAADQFRMTKLFEKKLTESLTEKGKIGLTEDDITAMQALTSARAAIASINREQVAVKKTIAELKIKQQQQARDANNAVGLPSGIDVVTSRYENQNKKVVWGSYRSCQINAGFADIELPLIEEIYWTDSNLKNHHAVRTYFKDTTNVKKFTDWTELTGGGAQIVSGVVNVNGTITFTDSEGNSFTTSGESVIGADGFSPVATVTQTASGATVSITDSTGTTTANISNGQDGTDYVLTNADKQEIAQMAVNLLPNADMVSY